LLVDAGSGSLTFGVPSSAGVPAALAALTAVVPYNDFEALERAFAAAPEQIACCIIEPIAANMGLVPPQPGYLKSLIDIAHRHGALVIFDEVITGFRVARGGAQALYGITPDLTCLGKIIGAGLPVGAFGGRADIMRRLAPEGDVYQAGTLSGNPLAMAAGVACLRELAQPGIYERLEMLGARLERGLRLSLGELAISAQLHRQGSVFTLFFNAQPVRDLQSVLASDAKAYARFFHGALDRGVALAPSAFEVGFISLAHSPADIDDTISVLATALKSAQPQVTTA
jgi:glutamate-1-semialdehyde 2,1-aminomutase